MSTVQTGMSSGMRPVAAIIVVMAAAVGCGTEDVTTRAPEPPSSTEPSIGSTPIATSAVPTSEPDSSASSGQTAPPASVQWTGPVPTLDLDGVPPVSAPLVLSEYLNEVQFAVRTDVGEGVFGGAVAHDADTAEMTLTIYGTDADIVSDAVDRIATGERDRITVVQTRYSASDLEQFASEAQSRLDGSGIDAYVMIRWGIDAVDVNLVTPDGEPDSAIEERAVDVLGDIPAVFSFSPPMTPLSDS